MKEFKLDNTLNLEKTLKEKLKDITTPELEEYLPKIMTSSMVIGTRHGAIVNAIFLQFTSAGLTKEQAIGPAVDLYKIVLEAEGQYELAKMDLLLRYDADNPDKVYN
jgi:hypothetical protein